jgi:hypothetical protein
MKRGKLPSGAALATLLALGANGASACSDYRTCERLRTCVVPGGAGGTMAGGTVGSGGSSGGIMNAAGNGGTGALGAEAGAAGITGGVGGAGAVGYGGLRR